MDWVGTHISDHCDKSLPIFDKILIEWLLRDITYNVYNFFFT